VQTQDRCTGRLFRPCEDVDPNRAEEVMFDAPVRREPACGWQWD
jgi:hypothetical protein